jgi:hypothetical protein
LAATAVKESKANVGDGLTFGRKNSGLPLSFPQPHAGAAAVFVNEFDAFATHRFRKPQRFPSGISPA